MSVLSLSLSFFLDAPLSLLRQVQNTVSKKKVALIFSKNLGTFKTTNHEKMLQVGTRPNKCPGPYKKLLGFCEHLEFYFVQGQYNF